MSNYRCCSFCGERVLNDESVHSEDNPDCVLCFYCVHRLHEFYMVKVFPWELEQRSVDS